MKRHTTILLTATAAAVACTSLATQAAVITSDNGLAAPTLGANDTGYAGVTNQRFGWDSGEGFTQSFTVPEAGFIGSIYLGYNAFNDGETITLDLSVNGNLVESGIFLNGDDFSGDSGTDSNTGPFYWMEFDLSSEAVPVTAGLNSFSFLATADTGASWALAPRYAKDSDPYAGGVFSGLAGVSGGNDDLAFAVTVIPEPASMAVGLIGLGGLALRRRRHA